MSIKENEVEELIRLPGPGHMCFHYLKPMHRCTLEPDHDGDHWYSKFTVTDITENTEEKKEDVKPS